MELKKCLFCGKEPRIKRILGIAAIECPNCYASMAGPPKKEIIKNWNIRYQEDET